jgi:hypothetical protein
MIAAAMVGSVGLGGTGLWTLCEKKAGNGSGSGSGSGREGSLNRAISLTEARRLLQRAFLTNPANLKLIGLQLKCLPNVDTGEGSCEVIIRVKGEAKEPISVNEVATKLIAASATTLALTAVTTLSADKSTVTLVSGDGLVRIAVSCESDVSDKPTVIKLTRARSELTLADVACLASLSSAAALPLDKNNKDFLSGLFDPTEPIDASIDRIVQEMEDWMNSRMQHPPSMPVPESILGGGNVHSTNRRRTQSHAR